MSGCWLWTGWGTHDGYGRFAVTQKVKFSAHRFAYELYRGPIPLGRTLDHLCRVRRCVNPAHLEPVSLRENILRGEGLAALNASKTHCPEHLVNLVLLNSKGDRGCRLCYRRWVNASWHRNKHRYQRKETTMERPRPVPEPEPEEPQPQGP